MTDYHSKYYAHALTRRSASDSLEKLGHSLLNATVDLNPHQIDAALFAFRSPLSRGALLADEVGLGKTIEAGLIISQLWAEHRRRILVIVPTTLRKQWAQELVDKFFLPVEIIDARTFNAHQKEGVLNPFTETTGVVICSYHFTRAKEEVIRKVDWDLVVIDEAHRLRNVYKSGNKIARSIKATVQGRPKVLLTATPLQNSLLELYGLVGFLDEHLFGNLPSFRRQYTRGPLDQWQFEDLKGRLRTICQRTLRRQVTEYVRYTNRIPITQDFTPTDQEQRLYDVVSEYLRKDKLQALPTSQRRLMTLVLRKLLASSTFAIAGTLKSLRERLEAKRNEVEAQTVPPEEDFEPFEELEEEWTEDETGTNENATHVQVSEEDRITIQEEIKELSEYHNLASSITHNAKGQALLQALNLGFIKLETLGANRKAVIFTESRRTQEYLRELLEGNGYKDQVLTFSGSNTDAKSKEIYESWKRQHAGEDIVTGSKTVDIRGALVEHFQEQAAIMVATEAAAEGINLQFCSLVVNYDLPWNPQRIEQRIGRCHRYGQKHDVVVINFLNRRNEADQRVFQLLSEKFRLFDGVFGVSDEVLGALESGVEFEKRIVEIYQTCRTSAEIDEAFNTLQQELEEHINVRMTSTRAQLLENFDEEVHARLRTNYQQATAQLDRLGRWLWKLTYRELSGSAVFHDEALQFDLKHSPADCPAVPAGRYQLVGQKDRAVSHHLYRMGHPLAEFLIGQAAERPLEPASILFNYGQHPGKVSLIANLIRRTGVFSLTKVTVQALEQEDHLLFAALEEGGGVLDQETCEKLFEIGGQVRETTQMSAPETEQLQKALKDSQDALVVRIAERNKKFFEEEIEKLERWAEDLKEGLELELKELDGEIKLRKKEAKLQPDLEAKLVIHRKIKELEAERTRKRRALFEAQDEIDRQKEDLINHVEAQLHQQIEQEELFTIRWEVQ